MMKNNVLFHGIMPALVSPLNEDGSIREKEVRRLINWHLESGCTGFYVCGGTGEGIVMLPESRKQMAEIVVDEVKERGKVMVHVRAVDLTTAVSLAGYSALIGATAISAVPPVFFNYGLTEIYQFYDVLSKASGLPLVMYASPAAGVKFSCEMVDKLMEIDTMIGLKWTSYDYFDMNKIKQLRNANINVINGPDELLSCGLVMGADGGIGASYNCIPKTIVEIYDAFCRSDITAMMAAQEKANKIISLLLNYGVLNTTKEILSYCGYDVGQCTYPIKRLSDDERDQLHKRLRELRFEEEYI